MKTILNNEDDLKYLESLPFIYVIIIFDIPCVIPVKYSKEIDKYGKPLVWWYYDNNGACDEYRLVPIDRITSYEIYDWTSSAEEANEIVERLRNGKI